MTQQEMQFEQLMDRLDIQYTMHKRLDYYLPEFDLLVELKTYECERLIGQLESVTGQSVMVLVGPQAVIAFGKFLERYHKTKEQQNDSK